MDLIIKNGTIVTASDIYRADIGIENGKIRQIGLGLGAADKEIDVKGRYILPGLIDAHTHVDIKFQGCQSVEDFYSGTAAAANGGVTTIIDYVIPDSGDTLEQALAIWKDKAKGKAVVDYSFHIAMLEPDEINISQMADMVTEGFPSFKIFMSDNFDYQSTPFLDVMVKAGKLSAIVNVHAEDGGCLCHISQRFKREGRTGSTNFAASRPPLTEGIAAQRAVGLAQLAETPLYLVHLSCSEGVEAVNQARQRGQIVYGETRPCYLLMSDAALSGENGDLYTSWPPLRNESQLEAMWQYLNQNILQVIATDHDGWSRQQKQQQQDVENMLAGMPQLETYLSLLYTEGILKKRMQWNRLVEVCCTNPAKIFGMYPEKGTLAIGSDADLVVFDTNQETIIEAKNLHSRSDFDPYAGWTVKGRPVMTFSRGELIMQNNRILASPGRGQLIRRKPFSEV